MYFISSISLDSAYGVGLEFLSIIFRSGFGPGTQWEISEKVLHVLYVLFDVGCIVVLAVELVGRPPLDVAVDIDRH